MTALRLLATTARTASLLVAPQGVRFRQKTPIRWTLFDHEGQEVSTGLLQTAALFLEDLQPAQHYRLDTSVGELEFDTPPCAGLVEASEFGVDGDNDDNAAALARAIAAVPKGGMLRLPQGRIQTGPIFLKPKMTLWLPAGAELTALADRSDWPKLPAIDGNDRALGTWEGEPAICFAAPVTAIDCDELKITGLGVIDGGGDRGDWWTWPKETRDGARRPRTLHVAYSDNVDITGITVRNSPSWTVHPYQCRDLHVSALKIQNPPNSPNTDGLNPESCVGVVLATIEFSVGDDCIAIKAGKRGPDGTAHLAPTEDIRVTHCLMRRGHGAVVLGSEMSGGIHDVTIADCEFHATDRGLRLKTRRGRGGEISGIHLANVDMFDVPTPLAVNAFYFCDPDGKDDWVQSRAPTPRNVGTPTIRDVSLTNVCAQGVTLAAAAVLGLPESPVKDLRFTNFRVSYAPNARAEPPLMAVGVAPVSQAGIVSEFAEVTGTLDVFTQKEIPETC